MDARLRYRVRRERSARRLGAAPGLYRGRGDGEGGRLELHVACLELPGVVRFVETTNGSFAAYDGPVPARIVVRLPGNGLLHYLWWYARDESEPSEQPHAEVRLTG